MALVSGSLFAFIPFGIFGLIFFPIGVVQMRGLRDGASIVALYKEGFAALVKSNVSLWPWDGITTITTKDRYISTNRGGSITDERCEITKEGGETVIVLRTELTDAVVLLIKAIKDHVGARLLPPLQKAYDAGQTLNFGPINVSRAVIEADGHRLDWGAIRNVVVKDGRLVVNPKEGKPFEVKVSRIPNVDLLCAPIGVKYTRMDLAYRW